LRLSFSRAKATSPSARYPETVLPDNSDVDLAGARLTAQAFAGLVALAVVVGALLFVPAGTLRYPEAWVFLAVFFGSSLAVTLYLMRRDPKLLERRVKAGPAAEQRPQQRMIQGLASSSFLALIAVPALDHRFGWSHVPVPVVVAGEALVALGFLLVFLVFRKNSYASAVIEVGAEQKVIDTGPYAHVRHPMYAGALVLLAGIPLALGSFWGLLVLVPFTAVIAWRLLDEEAFLVRELPGYAAYQSKTRYHLIPFIW
jgi:protein-S-isoprenylcysteine O-methyltransferase Ste14